MVGDSKVNSKDSKVIYTDKTDKWISRNYVIEYFLSKSNSFPAPTKRIGEVS